MLLTNKCMNLSILYALCVNVIVVLCILCLGLLFIVVKQMA